MEKLKENLKVQRAITAVAFFLFSVKIYAWYVTGSVAILTDALESIVNILSAVVGMYSLYLSSKPKDDNHPYGHGKAEFLSAAFEGFLIIVAGFIIIYDAIQNLRNPQPLTAINLGIVLIAGTALVNFFLGLWALNTGRRNNNLLLTASGKHLQTDTWSTVGIIAGLILIAVTGYRWLDSVVALLFAGLIIYTGLHILRKSFSGIMDEADENLLNELVDYLNSNKRVNWIDLHNLRIIKYGSVLHLDCHLTVPWYLNVNEAHDEVDALSRMIREKYGNSVELFVHTDGCLEFSCRICIKDDCPVRKHDFVKRVNWNVSNISSNEKHHAAS